MPYIVDFKKVGDGLLLDLVNHENEKDYKLEDLDLTGIPEVIEEEGFNTQVVIRTKDNDVDYKDVTVKYNRIDLGILFSITGCRIREVDLNFVDGDLLLDEEVYAAINRRYGVNATPTDFTLSTGNNGGATLTALTDSLAYIGELQVDIIPSLATLIPNVVLDGFKIGYYGRKWIISPLDHYPVGSVYNTTSKETPENQFGGVWEEIKTLALSSDEMFYYNHPLGFSIDVYDVDVPTNDAYEFIALHMDAVYNANKAELIEVEGAVPTWKITSTDSPFLNETIDAVDSVAGSRTFMLISKKEGQITNSTVPIYSWKRVA